MNPNEKPPKEILAATDAFFEQEPIVPEEQTVVPVESPEIGGQNEAPIPLKEDGLASPLADPVRALQQEYEEQEEQGKIPPVE